MGYGWRGGDMAREGLLTVPTAQALRDYPISDLPVVGPILTLGALAAGDGGGGVWRYADGEVPGTYADDLGTVLLPTGGDGSAAWLRIGRDITPEAFGAAGTGVADDDDAAAWQAALDVCEDHAFRLVVPPRRYWIGQSLKVCDGTTIHFEAGATLIHGYSASGQQNATLTNVDHEAGNADIALTGIATFEDPYFTVDVPQVEWLGQHIGFYKVTRLYAERLVFRSFRQWATALLLYDSRIDVVEVDNPLAASNRLFATDGLHLIGGYNVSIGSVIGTTGDDLCALVCSDSGFALPCEDIANISIGSIESRSGHACNLLKIHVASGAYAIRDVDIGRVVGDGGSIRSDGFSKVFRIYNQSTTGIVDDVHIGLIDVTHVGGTADNPEPAAQIIGNGTVSVAHISIGRCRIRTKAAANFQALKLLYADAVDIGDLQASGATVPLEIENSTNIRVNGGQLTPDASSRAVNILGGLSSGIDLSGIALAAAGSTATPIHIDSAEYVAVHGCRISAGSGIHAVTAANGAAHIQVYDNVAPSADFGNWLLGKSETVTMWGNVRDGVTYSGRGSCTTAAPASVTHGLNKAGYNVQLSTRNLEAKCYTTDVTANGFTVNAPDGASGTVYFDWVLTEDQ